MDPHKRLRKDGVRALLAQGRATYQPAQRAGVSSAASWSTIAVANSPPLARRSARGASPQGDQARPIGVSNTIPRANPADDATGLSLPGGTWIITGLLIICAREDVLAARACWDRGGRITGVRWKEDPSWTECPWELVCETKQRIDDGPADPPGPPRPPDEPNGPPGEDPEGPDTDPPEDPPDDGPGTDPGADLDKLCEDIARLSGPIGSDAYENALSDCLEATAPSDEPLPDEEEEEPGPDDGDGPVIVEDPTDEPNS